MAGVLRLFFAVDLDEKVRAEVARESHEIRKAFETDPHLSQLKRSKFAWVQDHGYHLTVKFLGATAEERLSEILEAARLALSDLASFEMEIAGVGAFPRVLWMDVRDPSSSLPKIASKLELALEPLGFARESRAYVPHLTIARLKEGKPIRAERDLKNEWKTRSLGKSLVREVILYKSDTRPTGAVYEPVGRISLHPEPGAQASSSPEPLVGPS